ncbi:MAG: RecX family transcriptional regulator [Candidatus Omnitrophica bacterium]|nr:RecX family transcriptional regulator [Candidatus Omnitrophota bacterium]
MIDQFKKALNYSFLLLKYRLRTVKEIKDRLKKKRFEDSIIEKVIDYLREHNYINDREFAYAFTKEKLERGFGIRRVLSDLRRLGIHHSLVEEILQRAEREFNQQEVLRKLIDKLYKRYKDKKRKREKIMRYLLQRGFSYDEILRYLEKDENRLIEE